MYLEHFQLTELPFRLSPDPAFLYLSKHHARAKAYMESTIWFTDGFVVITGEIGSGKTTLIETFLRELEKDVVVAQVAQTQVSPIEFLQAVLVQFGFSPFKMRKAELLATLNQFLVEQYAAGRKVLLIVDEAQNLTNRVLEEVRLLSGVETTKEKVLRIILCGQPELNEKLDSDELTQLVQRVRLRFHLTALTPEDTQAYILHRLEVAGLHGRQLFDGETFPVIFRYTGGVPRLINTICDTALMGAYALGRQKIGVAELMAAIDELQWVEFAARTNRMRAGLEQEPTTQRPVDADEVLARVIVAHAGEHVEERPLRLGRLIIGRTVDNDVQIDSKFISRHYSQIVTNAVGSVLEDLPGAI
jgi:type II secretory pathway predicted ATPase ExeA